MQLGVPSQKGKLNQKNKEKGFKTWGLGLDGTFVFLPTPLVHSPMKLYDTIFLRIPSQGNTSFAHFGIESSYKSFSNPTKSVTQGLLLAPWFSN